MVFIIVAPSYMSLLYQFHPTLRIKRVKEVYSNGYFVIDRTCYNIPFNPDQDVLVSF